MVTPKMIVEAEKNGIKEKALRERIRRGWSVEEAVTKPPQKFGERQRWLAVAKENGIPDYIWDFRYYRKGWSKEKAATHPYVAKPKKKKSKIDDRYTIYKKMAIEEGLSVAEFNRRVFDEGMSLEEAIH